MVTENPIGYFLASPKESHPSGGWHRYTACVEPLFPYAVVPPHFPHLCPFITFTFKLLKSIPIYHMVVTSCALALRGKHPSALKGAF